MERLLRLQLLATSTKPTKSRFLQLGQRLIDKCKQTTFFSQGTQGRAQQRRPTRRSRRKNGNEIPGEPSNLVLNISSYSLSPAELTVLQKGLSFCPTPKWDAFQLDKDLQRFYRSVRLKTHFCAMPQAQSSGGSLVQGSMTPELSISTLGLHNPSTFSPPHTYHATETFISLVDREIKSLTHEQRLGFYPTHNNLTVVEKQALDTLRSNKSIIIKPADKGGAVVVMDRIQYCSEITKQLSDTETYQIIPGDPTFKIRKKIQDLINPFLLDNTIDQKTATFLQNQHPITPVFYVLPKIHKSLINPPGRPIVASTDSILSPLSVFLEKILTPLIKTTRAFLLDTGQFLGIIKGIRCIPTHSLLVTLDVNSLYTSIEHVKGIAATKSLLEKSGMSIRTSQLCLELLTLILYENFFLYQDTYYVQTRGTAMGSNVAPAYANAFMNQFEIEHIYDNELFLTYVTNYVRYIDDIFFIWTGTADTLHHFFTYLNSISPGLQFTIHHDTQKISFLDTWVIKDDNGNLTTDIFTKPTDCNNLLHYSSCHPKTTKNSLPRSQFKRVSRIVTNPALRQDRMDTMAFKFQERKYPSKLLDQEKLRINSPHPPPPRERPKERLPFVHTHHPFMPKIYSVIRKHWSLLHKAYPSVEPFQSPPMMSTRRPKNIKDQLVRADIGSTQPRTTQRLLASQRRGTFPCLNCAACSNVIRSDTVTHPRTGKSYPIQGYFTCNTNFAIYVIKCPCGLLYVGETTQHVKDRIASHKSTIRCGKTWLPIPDHFVTFKHSVAQLKFQIIEQVPRPRRGGNHIKLLKARETFWIHTLDTLAPRGLNREIDWQVC
ncbi:uncharacterized protein LOC143815994 isoform X1 [Ranitomeya variabilis]|uniref:uncharacterized protein LOC143815994 isoform X1 n=1 Tax=Ranitomeya variabilis TaxID=490064 RepID=UPI004056D586